MYILFIIIIQYVVSMRYINTNMMDKSYQENANRDFEYWR